MKHSVFFVIVALLLNACAADPSPRSESSRPLKQEVIVDSHAFALWSRPVADAKGVIVLLHGRTWSSLPDFDLEVPGQQRSVMKTFNERGYTTYALDLRGYGETPRDASGWLTPDRAAMDLAGVLRWIGAREQRKPVLLGWSYGALVSQLTVQANPELVSDLILLGYPRDPAVVTSAVESPVAAPREVNTRERAASDFISPAVTPPALIDAYVKAALAADPVRTDWRNLEQFNALNPAKITVPTLLIHGEHDPLTPAAAQARLFTQLGTSDKQWVVLPGGDHAALIEDTMPAFIAATLAFVQRPGAGRNPIPEK